MNKHCSPPWIVKYFDSSVRACAWRILLILSLTFNAMAQGTNGDLIDYTKVKPLRWIGPGSPETYNDYQSAHVPAVFAATPVVAPFAGSPIPPAGSTGILVIANSTLYTAISNKIDRYCTDVRSKGYAVSLFSVTPGTVQELKLFIIANSNNVAGCVLIGNMPAAWFEVANDYAYLGSGSYGYASFPCDLYLMDLDGTWIDSNANGIYDIHTNNTAPEIFIGRIDASQATYGLETNLLTAYFDKLHTYYSGAMRVTARALTYTEDDWAAISYFSTDMGYAYAAHDAINAPSTSMTDFRDVQLPSTLYDFVQLSCHSSATSHSFTRGGWLSASAIRNVPPNAIAYNLFCCSACRFTTTDNLGISYIFNSSSYATTVIGSTKTGSMLVFNQFYTPFGQGKSMGEAFKEWFVALAPYSDSEISWHYGMTVLGDPMITAAATSSTQNAIPTLSGWGLIFFAAFLIMFSARRLLYSRQVIH